MANLIFILMFAFGFTANAQVNIIKNGDFEYRKSRWSASGGSFSIESTSPIFGSYSGIFDASASGQYLQSQAVKIDAGMVGRTCAMTVNYQHTGTEGDYKFKAIKNGSVTIAEFGALSLASGESTKGVLNFDCPDTATDTLAFQVSSEVASPGPIVIDNVFLGSDANTVLAKPQDVFSAKVSSSDVVSSENVNWINGDCTNASTGRATCIFNSGIFAQAPNCQITVDQPSAADLNHTIQVTASQVDVWTANVGTPVNSAFWISCQKVESSASSAEALTFETSGWFFDANIGGSNVSLGTAAVSTPQEMTNGSLDLVINSGSRPGRIACSGTNPPTGLTCGAGNESVGVNVDIPYAGLYEACFDFGTAATIGGTSTAVAVFEVVETPSNAQTVLERGKTRVSYEQSVAATNNGFGSPFNVCGTFNWTSSGNKTLRLFYTQNANFTSTHNVLGDRSASFSNRDIHVVIKPITQQMPAPVFTALQNVVKSGVSGTKVGSAGVNCITGPTIAQNDQGMVASVVRNSAGDCTINFTPGYWSLPPVCTVISVNGTIAVINTLQTLPTVSSARVISRTDVGGVTEQSQWWTCIGQ